MLEQAFDVEQIISTQFGVTLRNGQSFYVPTDASVQGALQSMLRETAAAFAACDGDWEEYSVSEDYGARRKIYASTADELMDGVSHYVQIENLPDMANLQDNVAAIDRYFAVFVDGAGRKAVAIRRAAGFKGALKQRNKLVRITNNSLTLIEDDVLKLDEEFDVVLCALNIFILNTRAFQQVADITAVVSSKAVDKLVLIEQAVSFLDLSRIAGRISQHPGTARLAVAVARRPDLALFVREAVETMAAAQGITLQLLPTGRLRPNVAHEHKLLELLDDRRYVNQLTSAGPLPYRAFSRQRVRV